MRLYASTVLIHESKRVSCAAVRCLVEWHSAPISRGSHAGPCKSLLVWAYRSHSYSNFDGVRHAETSIIRSAQTS